MKRSIFPRKEKKALIKKMGIENFKFYKKIMRVYQNGIDYDKILSKFYKISPA